MENFIPHLHKKVPNRKQFIESSKVDMWVQDLDLLVVTVWVNDI